MFPGTYLHSCLIKGTPRDDIIGTIRKFSTFPRMQDWRFLDEEGNIIGKEREDLM